MAKTNPLVKTAATLPAAKAQYAMPSTRILKWLVFLSAFVLYINSIPNSYNLDDELVTINHRLTSKGISAIGEIFTSPYYQDNMGYSYEYRPVVLVSFAIEHQFFGDNPHVSHFFNLLLYALCCIVLFNVLLQLFKNYSPLILFAITMVFIVHPAHTEVVCSIKNRDEILGMLFSLLTLSITLLALDSKRLWLLAFTPLLFAIALMSKVTVISFVFILPLALILFTQTSFPVIVAYTLLLEMPSYLLINVGSGFYKILLLLGLLLGVIAIYAIVNFKVAINTIYTYYAKFRNALFAKHQLTETTNTENTSYNYKSMLVGIQPDKAILFSITAIVFTLIPALFYFLCMLQGYTVVALGGMLVLLLLVWRGNAAISWWASAMFFMLMALNMYFLKKESLSLTVYSQLGMQMFVFNVFYGKRKFAVPALVAMVVFMAINFIGFGFWGRILYFIQLLLVFKVGRLALLAMYVSFIATISPFVWQLDIYNVIEFVFGIATIITIQFHRGRQQLAWVMALTALSVMHIFILNGNKSLPVTTTYYNIAKAADKINPKIIAKPDDRPLSFVEICVNNNSPLNTRIGTSLEIVFHYLYKVICPYPLSFYYGYSFISPMQVTETIPIISLILHLLLIAIALALLKLHRAISFGIIIYLTSILVFSNFFQPVPGMLADRFLLIPSLGWAIVFVLLLQIIFKIKPDAPVTSWKQTPAPAKYIFITLVSVYALISFTRNFQWSDHLTLFTHDIDYVDQSAQAHNVLAFNLMHQSTIETDPQKINDFRQKALTHFKEALKIYPRFFNVSYDLGRTYLALNMPDSAINAFKYSLTLDTTFTDVQFNLSQIYMTQGKFAEAIPYLEQVVRIRPQDYKGYDQLSFAYFRINEFDKSIDVNKKAIKLFPNVPNSYANIGRAYLSANQIDSGRYYINVAAKIAPDDPNLQQMVKELGKPK